MKKITLHVFLLMTVLAVCSNAFAQKKTAEEKAAGWTEWMKTQLKLTEAQLPKVQAINSKYATKLYAIKSDTAMKQDAKAPMIKQNETDMDGELKGVLTDEQYNTYVSKKNGMDKEAKEKKSDTAPPK